MKSKKFETETREAKFIIDNHLINTERYKRVPLSRINVRKEYGCWDLTIAYEGLKKPEGVVILNFKDDTYFTPGEDAYVRTDIIATFLLMDQRRIENLEKKISNIINRLKEEATEDRKKNVLKKLGFGVMRHP